jgi:methylated-DNA-[protein]-cysteine S-methyltransferase
MKEYFTYHSLIGFLQFETVNGKITAINFVDDEMNSPVFDRELQNKITFQMDAYFEGKLFAFDLPLNPAGTDFQKKVWKQLETIPYGQILTYNELALQMSDKNLVRAVGGANSKNQLAIVVPCHRVIGANNKLVGYAGGLWRKKWLLQHEIANNPKKTTLL